MSYAATLLLRYLKDSRAVALSVLQGVEYVKQYQQVFNQVTRCGPQTFLSGIEVPMKS